ncbi:MAG: alpha/beta hydrolase [Firmicutes bacterium]|nr:alpha/beta hydrolase [Bacillota bacterium]
MNFLKKTDSFESTILGKQITYYIYLPLESIEYKGVLQIAHGMAEHLERYEPFIEYLTAHGYIVCGNDHLAHGRSVGSKDELGHIPGKEGWMALVQDLHQLYAIMHEQYPNLPYFLMGHSMGSFLARSYVTRYGKDLAGAIIMGTGLMDNATCTAGLGVMKTISLFKGKEYHSPMVQKLMFGSYLNRIQNPSSTNDWLSTVPGEVQKYDADEYCGFSFSLSGYANVVRLIQSVCAPEAIKGVPADLPVLVTSGEEDPVGHYGDDPRKLAEKLQQAGVKDVELLMYAGDRHEILNESNRQKVFEDILAWLDKHQEEAAE